MHLLIGQAPEGADERNEEQRFLPVRARCPTGSGSQWRRAATLRHLDGHAAERQQMQLSDYG
jgi:hypothetical protein